MVSASAKINYEWAYRFPGAVPFIMLTEFPRSGGNWVRDMLGDALQLPVPRFGRFPVTFASIAHNHDARVLQGQKAVYVYRDGRDVFLSHLDKTISTFLSSPKAVRSRILTMHQSLRELESTNDRSVVDQSQFYREWTRRSIGGRRNWGAHVGAWLSASPPQVAFVRYEDMKQSPEEALRRATRLLSDKPIPDHWISFAVARNSFEAQTGRKAGEKDVNSTKRTGVVGSWRLEMSADVQEAFVRDFGEVLRQGGYEA